MGHNQGLWVSAYRKVKPGDNNLQFQKMGKIYSFMEQPAAAKPLLSIKFQIITSKHIKQNK